MPREDFSRFGRIMISEEAATAFNAGAASSLSKRSLANSLGGMSKFKRKPVTDDTGYTTSVDEASNHFTVGEAFPITRFLFRKIVVGRADAANVVIIHSCRSINFSDSRLPLCPSEHRAADSFQAA
ncbi:hypothetical protein GE107_11030 [Cohnella sp. CFH 77786]|uniref:hypothetical protein n=1 Tax=Cohnella sp. CFH 77786 TaxID=2662265 RepID=UPI001C60B197|nr:hypothetical protein [Cohnella sp. CFH 77786]MBW5446593.1 hypothetical protein [Cohnella sp. CFH 77786]